MKKAAIYARYSTNLQNESSIEDQVNACRAYASREKLQVVRVFSDAAKSGASLADRPAFRDMMEAAQRQEFDCIVVFDLSRLSRDMEDLAGCYKRLNHAGVTLRAVHEGEINTVLVGLRGLIGQLYREDNARNIRRAGEGRVRRGLASGSQTYGYAAVPGEPGKRVIVESEAKIIRRIFQEYIDGATPREIAAGLNRDRIPAPRGKRWAASTLNGFASRGSGILNNEIYAGRIVWNKVRMVKHPDTGKRLSRPNPPDQWVVSEVPALAIVSAEVFEAVKARRKIRSHSHPTKHQRPKHLLSGLLRCAACGGGLSVSGPDRSGRDRIQCSTHKESRSCPAPETFYLDVVESAVLDRLKAEFRKPVLLSVYVDEYTKERRRLAKAATKRRGEIEKRLAVLRREGDRIVDQMIALPKGADLTPIAQRLNELGAERSALEAELAQEPPAAEPVFLHPALIARYERQLDNLQSVTAEGIKSGDSGAAEAIRQIIDRVIVRRGEAPGTVAVEIHGKLDALLGPAPTAKVRGVMSGGPVVARGRYSSTPRHGTFVLRSPETAFLAAS